MHQSETYVSWQPTDFNRSLRGEALCPRGGVAHRCPIRRCTNRRGSVADGGETRTSTRDSGPDTAVKILLCDLAAGSNHTEQQLLLKAP